MNEIFFSLLRLALGTQEDFPYEPSASEWLGIREMAQKQSVLGVAFAGLQKLRQEAESNLQYAAAVMNLQSADFFEWMGHVAMAQESNERLNTHCIELQRILREDGFDSIILKGQGSAALYGQMASLRQPGDIDIWVMPHNSVAHGVVKNNFAERKKIISDYCKSKLPTYDASKEGTMHTDFPIFKGTTVEMHFTPSTMSNPRRNARFQHWLEQQWAQMQKTGYPSDGFKTPSAEFNLVYMLQHIYKHTLFEGIGLRQIMDYYFLLLAIANKPESKVDCQHIRALLRSFGLYDIAQAVNWVMWQVFEGASTDSFLLSGSCPLPAPEPGRGRLLYDMILEGGNFGHHSKYVINRTNNTGCRRLWRFVSRNAMLFRYYHNEVLWHLARKLAGDN